MDPNERSIGSANIMIGGGAGSQASSAFMVNDRTGGSDNFRLEGTVRQQHGQSQASSQFMVNDRSNASSAFMVNDGRSLGS